MRLSSLSELWRYMLEALEIGRRVKRPIEQQKCFSPGCCFGVAETVP
jgi:hypothetical protein